MLIVKGSHQKEGKYEKIRELEFLDITVLKNPQEYIDAIKSSITDTFLKGIAGGIFAYVAGIFTSAFGLRALKRKKEADQGAK
jgi:hypothetical protein